MNYFRGVDHEYFVPKELYQRVFEKCLSFDITILSEDLNKESTLTNILIRLYLFDGTREYDRQHLKHRSIIHQYIWSFQRLHKSFCVEDEAFWLPMLIEWDFASLIKLSPKERTEPSEQRFEQGTYLNYMTFFRFFLVFVNWKYRCSLRFGRRARLSHLLGFLNFRCHLDRMNIVS